MEILATQNTPDPDYQFLWRIQVNDVNNIYNAVMANGSNQLEVILYYDLQKTNGNGGWTSLPTATVMGYLLDKKISFSLVEYTTGINLKNWAQGQWSYTQTAGKYLSPNQCQNPQAMCGESTSGDEKTRNDRMADGSDFPYIAYFYVSRAEVPRGFPDLVSVSPCAVFIPPYKTDGYTYTGTAGVDNATDQVICAIQRDGYSSDGSGLTGHIQWCADEQNPIPALGAATVQPGMKGSKFLNLETEPPSFFNYYLSLKNGREFRECKFAGTSLNNRYASWEYGDYWVDAYLWAGDNPPPPIGPNRHGILDSAIRDGGYEVLNQPAREIIVTLVCRRRIPQVGHISFFSNNSQVIFKDEKGEEGCFHLNAELPSNYEQLRDAFIPIRS